MVWCNVSVVDRSVDVCWCGAEDGECIRVFLSEFWMWYAFCRVFGFGWVDGEASVLHNVLNSGGGLGHEVCRDANV